VGLVLLALAYIFLEFFAEPFNRMFILSDKNLQFPHALVERVPLSWMFFYAGFIPLAVISVWVALSRTGYHRLHVSILGFLIGALLTSFVTDLIKNAVGRPRPDLISRCKPRQGTPENVLVTLKVCSETDHHVLHDGWRAFPSGHASFAFSGLGFLALFLAGQMHVFRPEGDLPRGLLAIAPLLGAAMIAISRCEDYRHDVYDVTCGSVLGIVIAYWSYRRFFPKLRNERCDEPYPPSFSGDDGFMKLGDDEEAGGGGAAAFTLGEFDNSDNI